MKKTTKNELKTVAVFVLVVLLHLAIYMQLSGCTSSDPAPIPEPEPECIAGDLWCPWDSMNGVWECVDGQWDKVTPTGVPCLDSEYRPDLALYAPCDWDTEYTLINGCTCFYCHIDGSIRIYEDCNGDNACKPYPEEFLP